MKVFRVLILAILLTGCTENRKTSGNQSRKTIDKKYKKLVEQMNKVQSTPNGSYFKFIPTADEEFKIEWGNANFKNETKTVYKFFTNFDLYFAWENKDFIVLRTDIIPRQGWLYYFLPLVPDKIETELENPVAYNADKNIVISLGFKTDTVLLINNIVTQQVQPVIESERCWNPVFFQRCIDSVTVTDEFLYYKFQKEKEKSETNKKFERKIELRI